MTATNGYAYGRAWESVGYMTNGEADDWGWGEEHAVSLTLEVGSSKDSFWPAPSRIAPIAAETVLRATCLGPSLALTQTLTLAVALTPTLATALTRALTPNPSPGAECDLPRVGGGPDAA